MQKSMHSKSGDGVSFSQHLRRKGWLGLLLVVLIATPLGGQTPSTTHLEVTTLPAPIMATPRPKLKLEIQSACIGGNRRTTSEKKRAWLRLNKSSLGAGVSLSRRAREAPATTTSQHAAKKRHVCQNSWS